MRKIIYLSFIIISKHIFGDVFRTVVPLAPIAVEKVGPQGGNQVVETQVTLANQILALPKSQSPGSGRARAG